MTFLDGKEADSDDELDTKRFDPLNDETEYLLDKSKAKYAEKYFKLHLTKEKIRSCILEDALLPGNDFFNPPEIDECSSVYGTSISHMGRIRQSS